MDSETSPKHAAHHAAPLQQYSDEAANRAFILALGIMASAGIILIIAVILSAFYLKTSEGIVHGITTALLICLASTVVPMSVTIHFLSKHKE